MECVNVGHSCISTKKVNCHAAVCDKPEGPALIRHLILCWSLETTMGCAKLGNLSKWKSVVVDDVMLLVRIRLHL